MRQINDRELPKAASSALNKAVAKVRTRTVRGVSKRTRIQSKHIRKRFHISRSNVRNMKAKMTGYQRAIPVSSVARSPARGKKVRALGKLYQGAFYNTTKRGGRLHAFQRKSDSRYPIDVVKIEIKKDIDDIFPKVSARVMGAEYQALMRRELIYRIKKNVRI
ncbi:MAG: phage tail protein [Cellvibrionaceae bacterium]